MPTASRSAAEPPPEEPPIAAEEMIDLMAALVERSLVFFDEASGRFQMLETVRQYGQAKLENDLSSSRIRHRHARWCADLAASLRPHLQGAQVEAALTTLTLEEANMRGALDWVSVSGQGVEEALTLCSSLALYWHIRGQFQEGRSHCAQALRLAGDSTESPDGALVTAATSVAGNLAYAQGDYADAVTLHRQALAAREGSADRSGLAMTLHNLAIALGALGDADRSLALEERALGLNRELGDREREASNLNSLAMLASQRGDKDGARALYEETYGIAVECGDRWTALHALYNLAELLIEGGDLAAGRSRLLSCLQECRRIETWPVAAAACELLADLESRQFALGPCAAALGAAESIRRFMSLVRSPAGQEAARELVELMQRGGNSMLSVYEGAAALSPREALDVAIESGSARPDLR